MILTGGLHFFASLVFSFLFLFSPYPSAYLPPRPGVRINRKLPYFYAYERKITLCPSVSMSFREMHCAQVITFLPLYDLSLRNYITFILQTMEFSNGIVQ